MKDKVRFNIHENSTSECRMCSRQKTQLVPQSQLSVSYMMYQCCLYSTKQVYSHLLSRWSTRANDAWYHIDGRHLKDSRLAHLIWYLQLHYELIAFFHKSQSETDHLQVYSWRASRLRIETNLSVKLRIAHVYGGQCDEYNDDNAYCSWKPIISSFKICRLSLKDVYVHRTEHICWATTCTQLFSLLHMRTAHCKYQRAYFPHMCEEVEISEVSQLLQMYPDSTWPT